MEQEPKPFTTKGERLPDVPQDLDLTLGETVEFIDTEGRRRNYFFAGQFPMEGEPMRNELGQRLIKLTDGNSEFVTFEDPERVLKTGMVTETEHVSKEATRGEISDETISRPGFFKPQEEIPSDTIKFYPPEAIAELLRTLEGVDIDFDKFPELQRSWEVEGLYQDDTGELMIKLKSARAIPFKQFVAYAKEFHKKS